MFLLNFFRLWHPPLFRKVWSINLWSFIKIYLIDRGPGSSLLLLWNGVSFKKFQIVNPHSPTESDIKFLRIYEPFHFSSIQVVFFDLPNNNQDSILWFDLNWYPWSFHFLKVFYKHIIISKCILDHYTCSFLC